ncbi:MAG: ROK family protein [Alphaproteobacteria bacterium]|jgi:fructokinase|nr:ROK family protein [Alphaproteobacteria bacterium]
MRIGIDLGGTKIEAIALGDNGETLARRRTSSPQGDYEATLAAIRGLLAAVEGEAGGRGSIGVATPGALSPASGLIVNSNSHWLIGRPLAKDLQSRLGRPVRLANDADCFALSEAVDGAACGAYSVFGVILGTGVGGGIVIDGRLLRGANAIAGEWGHNPLPWPVDDERPGPPCYCGRRGCIETFLSGPGLARDHATSIGATSTGASMAGADIAAAAAAGDGSCRATMARFETRLAKALASVINVIDPEVIVLGGGVSNIERLYQNLPGLWGEYVFSDSVRTRLAAARHGDSSGVRGAAWLWPNQQSGGAISS